MNTKLFLGILLMAFALTVSAQDDTYYQEKTPSKEKFFKYGIKAGYDMHPITFDVNEITEQLKGGYQAGIFLQFGRRLYLQPELYYAAYTNPASSISSEKITYLRVPVMLGLRLINLGIISAHLQGGPVFNSLLSDVQAGFSIDKFTYNWQVGVGVDIFGFITADARYTLLDGVEFTDQFTNFNPETATLNLTLGLKLR
jgi:hypothetical protein